MKCVQDNDKFKVSNDSAKLDYPIALITADEVAIAGGVYNTVNSNYYLYNGQFFSTMSPSHFPSNYFISNVWTIFSSGSLNPGDDMSYLSSARPVINLKADIKITSGDGTSIAPFKIATN